MKGLDISRMYFEKYGKDMIHERFPAYEDLIAAGLAGEGSECFGYDDILSQDHDFGPSFCLWLEREDFMKFGSELQKAYDSLPKDFLGYPARKDQPYGYGRVGVICMENFFRQQTGSEDGILTLAQWMRIPEERLAAVTNGEVFQDPSGRFTEIRSRFMAYYPEDVRIKKMAARAAVMGQAGQYNYARSMKRGETVAARHALSEFTRAACSLTHLLNKSYMPYYKWMHRSTMSQPRHGEEVALLLKRISENALRRGPWIMSGGRGSDPDGTEALNTMDENVLLIEQICRILSDEMKLQAVSVSESSFMTDHGISAMKYIRDRDISRLHLMEG